MTQRDIAKDKETIQYNIETYKNHIAADIAKYWIAQYEAEVKLRCQAQILRGQAQSAYADVEQMLKAAQARIRELEALLHPNNRKDVRSIPRHVGRPRKDG